MKKKSGRISRRDILKSLATVPVAGALFYSWYQKQKYDNLFKQAIQEEIKLSTENPVLNRNVSAEPKIRLGIIGTGGRGRSLLKATGFIRPEVIDSYIEGKAENRTDKRYEEFLEQDDLNVELNGVCDIYDINAERGLKASANISQSNRQ
ncbi:MAG: hypothetical protein R2750_13500 [Bacteroidales bacterium]